MNNFQSERSFLDEYRENIIPRLQAIDVLLKSNDYPLSVSQTSKTLEISNDEVFSIMGQLNFSSIDERGFLMIMRNGSSRICNLFKRELDCGSPVFYKPEQIAYIYGLDETQVFDICCGLNISEVNADLLMEIFSKIPEAIE